MLERLEVRCPVYGFISLSSWEYALISDHAFQRLRRIRQLAWTDYVYPGAMHTRFEHSLGVMHMATLLYQGVWHRSADVLADRLGLEQSGRERCLHIIRFAALLHDVGHAPFSHAAEGLTDDEGGIATSHEQYSVAIIKHRFKSIIEDHPSNNNWRIKIEEVCDFIEGNSLGAATVWRELISGQIDADRMDYLLRDSHHVGVDYGRFDWRRIVATICLVNEAETGTPRIGISEDGKHSAESLILARFWMYRQVYFHKTRSILDYHLQMAMREMLPNGKLPSVGQLDDYMAWDDWKVLGAISSGEGGDHGRRLKERDFYRRVWESPESQGNYNEEQKVALMQALQGLGCVMRDNSNTLYKMGELDLLVSLEKGRKVSNLSSCSSVISGLKNFDQSRIYVTKERREEAKEVVKEVEERFAI